MGDSKKLVDTKQIKEIAEIMNENDIVDVIIEDGDRKVMLSRAKEIVQAAPAMMTASMPVAGAPAVAPAAPVADAPAALPADCIEVKAPMVGTFYRAPSPTAANFVEVGQKIKTGDVLCIIEAMKLMNEIKSEVTGEIIEVCLENGTPIEFGQVLFRVKK